MPSSFATSRNAPSPPFRKRREGSYPERLKPPMGGHWVASAGSKAGLTATVARVSQ